MRPPSFALSLPRKENNSNNTSSSPSYANSINVPRLSLRKRKVNVNDPSNNNNNNSKTNNKKDDARLNLTSVNSAFLTGLFADVAEVDPPASSQPVTPTSPDIPTSTPSTTTTTETSTQSTTVSTTSTSGILISYVSLLALTMKFQNKNNKPDLFFVWCITCVSDSYIIGAHGTDVSIRVWLMSGENLLQEKNSAGRRWESNSGTYRYHSYCCKLAIPLCHLDLF